MPTVHNVPFTEGTPPMCRPFKYLKVKKRHDIFLYSFRQFHSVSKYKLLCAENSEFGL